MINFFLLFIILYIPAFAGVVSYEDIVKKAILEDIGLKILTIDKDITKEQTNEIRSSYYPVVSLNIDTKYTKNLEEQNQFSYIDEDDKTQYQSASSLNINYDIYDFGVLNSKVNISTIDEKIVMYFIEEKIQKLKLEILDIYGKVRKSKKEIFYYDKIQKINYKIYNHQKRLFQSKNISRVQLSSQAIAIVELDTTRELIREDINLNRKQLSFYTKENYSQNTVFKDINIFNNKNIEYENSFISKQLKLKTKQKIEELNLLNNSNYPVIKFYGSYNVYKNNDDSFRQSFKLDKKDYMIGFGININLFNGFKYTSNKAKLKAEMTKLNLENKEQKELFYFNKIQSKQMFKSINQNLYKLEENLKEQNLKSSMINRLSNIKNIDMIRKLKNDIENIQIKKELEIVKIKNRIKKKEMHIFGIK